MNKKILAALLTLLLCTIGCTQNPQPGLTATPSQTGTAAPTGNEKTEYLLGDIVQLGNRQVQVTEIKKSPGSEFEKPNAGQEYVIVSVNIKNVGNDNASYNPYDFKMQNSLGQITDTVFSTINSDTALSSGELTAGGLVSGTLLFEEPKDDTGLKLLYNPSVLEEYETISIDLMNSAQIIEILEGSTSASSAIQIVGDIGEIGNYQVQVRKVEKSAGTEFDKPKEGNEFIIVTVVIKNKGTDIISYNPLDFRMKNSKGQVLDTGFLTVDLDTQLASGDLAAGGLVSGTISYEQPKDDTLELIFTPSMIPDKNITIDLMKSQNPIVPLS